MNLIDALISVLDGADAEGYRFWVTERSPGVIGLDVEQVNSDVTDYLPAKLYHLKLYRDES